MPMQTHALLRSLPMFASVPQSCSEALAEAAHVHAHDKGCTLFLQGERAASLRFVLDGWVKLYRVAPCGGEAIIRLLSRGRSLEESAGLTACPHGLSAETVTSATILSIEACAFRRIARAEATIAAALLDAVADHARALTDDLEQMKVRNGVQRVALFLLDLAGPEISNDERGGVELRLPYEKHLIAGSLGMKPESLSRALARLKNQGVQVKDAEVSIADLGALRDFAQRDPALAWA